MIAVDSSALVAIVLVLASVFIPVAFLGGIAGELYRQFAVTVALSVVLSGFVALTLTPALCAILLKERKPEERKNRFFQAFDRGLASFTLRFLKLVKAGFANRRKTLINSLSQNSGYPKETLLQALDAAEISPGIRAEKLTAADFARLTDAVINLEQAGRQQ